MNLPCAPDKYRAPKKSTAIQERLAQAAPQDGGPAPYDAQREQMAQARRAKQEKRAKVVAINGKETAA